MVPNRGPSRACAACKFQRRKCTPKCPLAPYFPSHKPEVFRNVHRLFGVKKLTSKLETLPSPSQRADAMTSVIYEANAWRMFPARGCCHVIALLYDQIHWVEREIRAVYSELQHHRSFQVSTTLPSKTELGTALIPSAPQQHQSYDRGTATDQCPPPDFELRDNIASWIRSLDRDIDDDSNDDRDDGSPPIHPQGLNKQLWTCESSGSGLQLEKGTAQSAEHAAKNELESAAACFGDASNRL